MSPRPHLVGLSLMVLVAVSARPGHRQDRDSALRQDPCASPDADFPIDTLAAHALADMAREMGRIADSARELTIKAWYRSKAGGEFENGLPEYSTSAAEVALTATRYGPRLLGARRIAAELSYRASTMGEGDFNFVWAHRALSQVICAIQLSDSAADPSSFGALRKLEGDIRRAIAATKTG